eukprot:gnl/TRDRNA2_/TRDRNA2_165706_c1_seq1.p1 gnl/TRDRNA2_/TRDRNA2_165706_c1~~gnl/TRDRNA2_/TRDRNA2_165706_c1_seq1.p1  ORF type:complete len:169 (+),score=40.66 gnl/TRDRNA2_/TRDRNA2_165706_c1_seq1:2-508(+)
MNMLIGVLCEVVSAVAAAERENNAIRMVKDNLLHMLRALDEDGSGMIDIAEIQGVLEDEASLLVLNSLNIDLELLMDTLDMLYEDNPELSIQQIMDLILMLRGDRTPTMKDIQASLSYQRWRLTKLLTKSGTSEGQSSEEASKNAKNGRGEQSVAPSAAARSKKPECT